MAKKRLKKTRRTTNAQGKIPADFQKQHYYSFGIFVGEY
jgi:hypothetical protein